jgi:poly(A) polymerase
MTLPDRLPVAGWMAAAATRSVIQALEAAGGPDSARFVGGCVRNALIGRPIDDIDIATPLPPQAAMAALQAAGLKVVPTGIDHGTVTVIAQGQPFEVTTLRRDVETDGRRAVVAFTSKWEEDAQRRDFRLNALYMDGQGRLYDPVGGIADALQGRIVFVGDARTRIREDYLRILRFFRFRAWYGRGPVDAEGLAACAALTAGLARLSAERVSKELLKLLAAADPREAVGLMRGAGVLRAVLPAAADDQRFARLVALEREVLGAGDALLRLAALLPLDSGVAIEEADRLRLSRAQRERLAAAAAPTPAVTPALGSAAARGLIYRLGAPAFRDRVKLAWAGDVGGEAAPWLALLAVADSWTPPAFPVGGSDAAKAGVPPGPAMGAALRRAEDWWIDQDFAPDRAALIARLEPDG